MKTGKPCFCLIQTAYGLLSAAAHGSAPSTLFAPLYRLVLFTIWVIMKFPTLQDPRVITLLHPSSSALVYAQH